MELDKATLLLSAIVLPVTLLLLAKLPTFVAWIRRSIIIRRSYPHPPVASLLTGHLAHLHSMRGHRKFAEWAERYGGIYWIRTLWKDVSDGAPAKIRCPRPPCC